MLTVIRQDLLTRKEETENILHFAHYILNNPSKFKGEEFDVLNISTSLKSNIILMLYNAVEATVTGCLKKIHSEIRLENIKYSDLTPALQKICIGYHRRLLSRQPDIDGEVNAIIDIIKLLNSETNFILSFEELSKHYQLYSGNLDSKKIGNVLKKYGTTFDKKCSELKIIKDKRNSLAHGEQSFEEVGRELTLEQLTVMSDRSFKYLENMVAEVENFLLNKGYSQ